MKKNINKTNLSYLAGYIDGDGCFFINSFTNKNRTTHKFPQTIIIASANKEVLDWCKQLYGGFINTKYSVPKGHKPMHYYRLSKFRAIPITKKIYPYLVERREEAQIFIDFAASKNVKEKFNLISKMHILKETMNLVSKSHIEEFKELKNTITPTIEDFAYLAGFIDAECSLCISKYKPKNRPNYTYKILLQCNNTKTPVFKWLLQRFGGHINFIDRQKYKFKDQLCWRLSGKALSKILNKIYQFLKHKKPVCEQLIEFYSTTLINGGARHTEIFRSQYAEILKTREKIVTNVHKLNSKGINIV
jgi:hypothetical protein